MGVNCHVCGNGYMTQYEASRCQHYGAAVLRELRLLHVLRDLVRFAGDLCETEADYGSPELVAAREVLLGAVSSPDDTENTQSTDRD